MRWSENGWRPYGRSADRQEQDAACLETPGAPADAGEEELWHRWRSSRDGTARTALVELYAGYARRIAGRLYARLAHTGIEFEDYRQLAMLGLLESIDRYDPCQRARFRTYAMLRIRGAILNGLESLSERHQQIAVQRRLVAERTASLVRDPEHLGSGADLLEQLADLGVGVAISMILDGIGLLPGSRQDLTQDAYAMVEVKQLTERVWHAVEECPERERRVILMHYKKGIRFDEIARILGVSKGRVSQLHRQALLRVRAVVDRSQTCDVAL